MSIASIPSTGRVVSSTERASEPSPAARASIAQASVEIDELTQQPVPPRFPWLSRLSQQLESAAKQRAAFPSAPVLGDNLDQSA